MGARPNVASLEETERKLKSPLGAPRIMEQPRRHGSSARYIRDPMTQGYRPGGACRSCGTIPRKSCPCPGPFLVVSHYTIWTHGHNPPVTHAPRASSVQVNYTITACAFARSPAMQQEEQQQVWTALEPDIAFETAVLLSRPPKLLVEHPPKRTTFYMLLSWKKATKCV